MRKLRVGVWLQEDYRPEEGGGYGYYTQLISALNQNEFVNFSIVFLSRSKDENIKLKNVYYIKSKFSKTGYPKSQVIIDNFKSVFFKLILKRKYLKINEKNRVELEQELSRVVDIIYYPQPFCFIDSFPYIYTVWDIGHLSTYSFPEFSKSDYFESRKKRIDLAQKALMVFCESEAGKQEAIFYYNLNQKRVKVIPMFPSQIVNENIKAVKPIQITEQLFFIHYPAQFWSHKNHYNLLLAFKEVLIEYPELKLIFTGSDKGNKAYIFEEVKRLKIEKSVIDLGFVEVEELKWLYLNSKGLVMPTFLGPTNMPVLEAAYLGCPVSCSDLKGHREQLGNYANYFNPESYSEISQSIKKMLKENTKGKQLNNKFRVEDTILKLQEAFDEISGIRNSWK